MQNLKAYNSAQQSSPPTGSSWVVVCCCRATKRPAGNWIPRSALPAQLVSQHIFLFTGTFLLQGYSMFGVHGLLIFILLIDILASPGEGWFNVSSDETVSNPCLKCNLGYWLQICSKCSSAPFSSLYQSWPPFHFTC